MRLAKVTSLRHLTDVHILPIILRQIVERRQYHFQIFVSLRPNFLRVPLSVQPDKKHLQQGKHRLPVVLPLFMQLRKNEPHQLCQAVMLGRDLGVENTTQVQASNRIVRSGAQFYLLTDTGVECLSTDGTSQWTQSLSARPQGLLADRRQLLVFCGNTVQGLTPTAAENNAQSNT